MRRTAWILAAVLGACTWPGTSNTSTTATSTTGGGTQCPQATDCGTCIQCANSGPCAAQYDACNADPDCLNVSSCVASCGTSDTACEQSCFAQDPSGMSTYSTLVSCELCTQCPTACAGRCTSG